MPIFHPWSDGPATARPIAARPDIRLRAIAIRRPTASHGAAHRWRYAQVRTPAAAPFGWDIALHLGACGDAWQGSGGAVGADGPDGVERAWLSAQALAAALLREAAAWPRCTP